MNKPSNIRRFLVGSLIAVVVIGVWPPAALAHGLVGKQDLPIPGWLVGWAAAIVLIVSFAALAVLWTRPRWDPVPERRMLGTPRILDPLLGLLGVLLFAAAVFVGFAGEQGDNTNLLPTLVFAIFWIGVPIASLLFGDVFRAVNPWRAVGRFGGWLVQRVT